MGPIQSWERRAQGHRRGTLVIKRAHAYPHPHTNTPRIGHMTSAHGGASEQRAWPDLIQKWHHGYHQCSKDSVVHTHTHFFPCTTGVSCSAGGRVLETWAVRHNADYTILIACLREIEGSRGKCVSQKRKNVDEVRDSLISGPLNQQKLFDHRVQQIKIAFCLIVTVPPFCHCYLRKELKGDHRFCWGSPWTLLLISQNG